MTNVVTFRCGDELLEKIDGAADESPHETRAQFLRSHLEQTLGDGTESDRIESLSERVDETEREIEQIKRRLEVPAAESRSTPTQVDRDRLESNQSESDRIESNHIDSNTREQTRESAQERERSHTDANGGEIAAALEGFRPGRGPNERAERRESAHAVLEWLRDQPTAVTAGDVKRALYAEHGVDGQNESTWWEKTARPGLQHAAENGYVEIDGRSYEWADRDA